MKHWQMLVVAPFIMASLAIGAAEPADDLLSELKTLADRAKRERAADRWLERALDELIAKYDVPELEVLVFENFQDRRFEPSDRWRLHGGATELDRGYALVSTVDRRASTRSSGRQPHEELSTEDAVAGLLVGLLTEGRGTASRDAGASDEETAAPGEPATAILPADIPNSFLVEMEITLTETSEEARVGFSVFQSEAEHYGYSLNLKTGARGFVEIERKRGDRSSIVDSKDLGDIFADGKSHTLGWAHSEGGRVVVTLDDQVILDANDNAFRDDYKQLNITNRSGTLAVHMLKISG